MAIELKDNRHIIALNTSILTYVEVIPHIYIHTTPILISLCVCANYFKSVKHINGQKINLKQMNNVENTDI